MLTTVEYVAAWLRTRTDSERGASLVEYALLLALIAVVCIVGLRRRMAIGLGDSYSIERTTDLSSETEADQRPAHARCSAVRAPVTTERHGRRSIQRYVDVATASRVERQSSAASGESTSQSDGVRAVARRAVVPARVPPRSVRASSMTSTGMTSTRSSTNTLRVGPVASLEVVADELPGDHPRLGRVQAVVLEPVGRPRPGTERRRSRRCGPTRTTPTHGEGDGRRPRAAAPATGATGRCLLGSAKPAADAREQHRAATSMLRALDQGQRHEDQQREARPARSGAGRRRQRARTSTTQERVLLRVVEVGRLPLDDPLEHLRRDERREREGEQRGP